MKYKVVTNALKSKDMVINWYKCDQQNKLVSHIKKLISFLESRTFFGVKADKRYLKSKGCI